MLLFTLFEKIKVYGVWRQSAPSYYTYLIFIKLSRVQEEFFSFVRSIKYENKKNLTSRKNWTSLGKN